MPGPVSIDLELGDRAAVVHHELHAAGLRELDRVRQQVDQDLAQPLLVGIDHDAAAPPAA